MRSQKESAAAKLQMTSAVQAKVRIGIPRLALASGTNEAIKWLALLLMVLDHVNKYVLHNAVPALFAAGRLSFPLFAFVLAFNLARPGVAGGAGGRRLFKRLILFGAIASLPFVALGGLGWGWWPLNIMATFALAVGVIQLVEPGGKGRFALAVLLFVVGGAFVEFWWAGVALTLAAWRYCQRPSWTALLVWIAAHASLFVINHNWYALAALPFIYGASAVRLSVPRLRWFFYAFYPLHLALLWLLARHNPL